MRRLRRRYGKARGRPGTTAHQCPGCGEPVTVKRAKGPGDAEDRMCPRCQATSRREAARRRTEHKTARPKTVAVYDALGFYLGERPENMTDAEWIAATYGADR